MLPKIEIRCFKEKLNNISSLSMKKTSLKRKKIKMADFRKKICKQWHKPGKPGFNPGWYIW